MEKVPLFIAHKGDTVNHKENTVEAFVGALDKGADDVEMDVHLSDSGEIIVVHDYLYDRSRSYPRLDEVLKEVGTRGRVEVEIKELEEKALDTIRTVIDRYRVLDLEVTTSVQPLMPKIAFVFPEVHRGLIFRRHLIEDWMPEEFRIKWILAHMKLSGANVLHMDIDLYTAGIIAALRDNGITTHTHLKKTDNGLLAKVRELGIDQFTFDDIELLSQKNA